MGSGGEFVAMCTTTVVFGATPARADPTGLCVEGGAVVREANALSIGAMLCWGAAYVPSAWLIESWPPLGAAGARLAVGGLVLLVVAAVLGRSVRPGVGAWTIGWLALTQTVIFYGATYWGIAHAGAGLSAVLANTDPLFVAVLGTLLLGDRLASVQWLGLAAGLVGAGLVVWEGPLWPPEVSGDALVVVGGALAWSIGTVVAWRSVRGDANPLALAGWQMAAGGVLLYLLGVLLEEGGAVAGRREAGLILALAVVGSAVPLALFYLALARAPAAEVSAWFFLIPAIGVLSAWLLLGERPSIRLAIGLVGVSLGLWLVLGRRNPGGGRLVDSSAPP
jgi:drug/metabolite transporter (DMT)-like permease